MYGKSNEAKMVATSHCKWNAFMGIISRQSIRLLYPASLVLLRYTHLPGLSSRKSEKTSIGMDIRDHGLVYNPIFRLHFNRELWSAINIITAGIVVVSIFTLNIRDIQ